VASDFRVDRFDLGGFEIAALRLGDAASPDATIARTRVDFAWRPAPALARVRLEAPMLRARIDRQGVSLGSIDGLLQGDGGEARLPDMKVEIVDGSVTMATPYGALDGAVAARGALRRDFLAEVQLTERPGGALNGVAGTLSLRTDAQRVYGALALNLKALRAEGLAARDVRISGALETDHSLRGAASVDVAAGGASIGPVALSRLDGAARLERSGGDGWAGRATLVADAAGAGGEWTAPRTSLAVDFAESIRGALRMPHLALTRRGRAAMQRAWPDLAALPVGPLMGAAREAALQMLTDTEASAGFQVAAGVVSLTAIEARGRGGETIRVSARPSGAPMAAFDSGSGVASGAARIETVGGAFPALVLDLERWSASASELRADGVVAIADFRARGAALAAPALSVTLGQRGGVGEARVQGAIVVSGPLGGARVEDMTAPLDLRLRWSGNGVAIAPVQPCLPLRFARLALPGLIFGAGAAEMCAAPAGFYATDAGGGVSGGFAVPATVLNGHVADSASQPAQLTFAGADVRLRGGAGGFGLDATIAAPSLEVRLAADHGLILSAPDVDAHLLAAAGAWHAEGAIANAELRDTLLPAYVTEIAAAWSARPAGDDVVVQFERGGARLSDRAPEDALPDRRPAFNPMRIANVAGALRGGRVEAAGAIALEAGARPLGRFSAEHMLASGAGEALIEAETLVFAKRFQPHDISELVRSVVADVYGPVSGEARVRWASNTLSAEGVARLDNLSMATATMPVIDGVTGEVRFDDLFALTTPPGQHVTIALLNPGVAVRDGAIDFQLLGPDRVALERAVWPFAGGELAVEPAIIALGAEKTRLNLTLAGVDVERLLAELDVPDLAASGRVGGSFPLLLTESGAEVVNGTLTAEGPGRIAYAGRMGEETQGPARLAFDALRRLRYDRLALTLNGDLAGDLLTEISFRGESSMGVNLPGAPAAGPLRGQLAGVPFIFNVSVRAPFRRLGELAAGAFDPRRALGQLRPGTEMAPPPPAPIDPDAPGAH
jgi:hypothetical protein